MTPEFRQRWALPALLAVQVALLPYGRAAELGVLVGLLLLIAGLWTGRQQQIPALWWWMAGLPWLAAALSLSFAIDRAESAQTVLAHARFVLAGAGVLCWLRAADCERSAWLVLAVIAWWSLETLVQALIGVNFAGIAAPPDRYSGPFGDAPKLGPIYVSFLPIALLALWALGRGALVVGVLVGLLVLVLAGARAALLSALVVAGLVWWPWCRARPAVAITTMCGGVLALTGLLWIAQSQSPQVAERVERSLQALDGNYAALDSALAYRLSIWQPVPAIVAAAPLTGVGVRGFRVAFPLHASPDNRWLAPGEAQQPVYHPHQWVVEVLTETGLVGLLLWTFACVVAIRAFLVADREARVRAWPYALALVALMFPLNTHNAVYASYTGLYLWWLVLLYVGALRQDPADG